MDDDDGLTRWNPDHFGHTDFQKENDGQLTIFFEDTNEPPDPDDFASIADYEIAWDNWEQTQTLPQEDTIMTFSIATPFDSEIELLKAKLAELETQKHRVSTCANRIVEQAGECVIEMKEAGVGDAILTNWACAIYKEITGENVPALSDSDVLKGAIAWEEKYKEARQKVAESVALCEEFQTKIELLESRHESAVVVDVDQLIKERNEALDKFVELTESSVRVAEELKGVRASLAIANKEAFDARKELADLTMQKIGGDTDGSLIEGYKKTITELTIANQKITEEVLKLRGESPFKQILEEAAKPAEPDTQPKEIEEDPRQNPEFLEATNNQGIVSKFLRKLDRIARVDKLDWVKIKELPLNLETMRELGLQVSPKSKTNKYLLEQMPVMCAKYIMETGDSSDLDWLPGHFVESVREALSAESDNESTGEEEEEAKKSPRTTSLSEVKPTFQRGDTVRHLIHIGDICTVLDVNGEWLNIQDADGLTDMWSISDVELVAESAA